MTDESTGSPEPAWQCHVCKRYYPDDPHLEPKLECAWCNQPMCMMNYGCCTYCKCSKCSNILDLHGTDVCGVCAVTHMHDCPICDATGIDSGYCSPDPTSITPMCIGTDANGLPVWCCCYHEHVDTCIRRWRAQNQRQAPWVRRLLEGRPRSGGGGRYELRPLRRGLHDTPADVIDEIVRHYEELPPPSSGQFRLLVT